MADNNTLGSGGGGDHAAAGTSGAGGEAGGGSRSGSGKGGKMQDRYLPIANIARIMRKGVPENVKISKDAKDIVQECVSEFIAFITSEASLKCKTEKRKTITGDDLLWSIESLGFEEYGAPLKRYLEIYRKLEGESKGSRSSSTTDQSGKKDGGANADATDATNATNAIEATNATDATDIASI